MTNALPLGEGKTYYKHLNDIIRQLMADIREESNEVRALIAANASDITDANAMATSAKSRADGAERVANGINNQLTEIQSTASEANTTAGGAYDIASDASTNATSARATAEAVQLIANNNQSSIASLTNRVKTLEDNQATGGSSIQTDGTTIVSANSTLKVKDIAIGGISSDLASSRGQIGRTAISSAADLDGLVLDGWYAVGSTTIGKPSGTADGIVRVSSSHTSGATFQSFYNCGETSRVFIRSTMDGTAWTAWREPLFTEALGETLTVTNGVIDVVFPQVLPDSSEADPNSVLTAGGEWVTRVTQEELQIVLVQLSEMAESLSILQEKVAAAVELSQIEPDGETLMEIDGYYSVPMYLGPTEEENGVAGLVPPAEAGEEGLFLKSDGSWADPALEYVTFDGEAEGLVPLPEEGEEGFFLRADGQWADPLEEMETRVAAIEEADPVQYEERISELENAIVNGAQDEEIDAIFAESS